MSTPLKKYSIDHSYIQFYGDDFLRLLMLRFVFYSVVVLLHKGFKVSIIFYYYLSYLI